MQIHHGNVSHYSTLLFAGPWNGRQVYKQLWLIKYFYDVKSHWAPTMHPSNESAAISRGVCWHMGLRQVSCPFWLAGAHIMSILIGRCPYPIFSDHMQFMPYWLSKSLNITMVWRILKKNVIFSKMIPQKWGDWLSIFFGVELKCKISNTHYYFMFLWAHFMGKIANAPA